MQLPMDRSGLAWPLGLLTECSVAWLFAILFPLLARPAGRPGFFRAWTVGLFSLALGLTAFSLRYLLPQWFPGFAGFKEGTAIPQLLYVVHQVGKLVFAGALLDGALCLHLGGLSRRGRLMLWGPLAAVGLESLFLLSSLEALVAIQSVGMAICSLFAARVLARGPPRSPDLGGRATIVALTGQALVWPLYAVAAMQTFLGGPSARVLEHPLSRLLAHSAYVDLALLVLLALGQILVLIEGVRQQKERVQEEKARLEIELGGLQKLRTMGWFVAGAAHDLNNPLMAILGFARELEVEAQTPRVTHASRVIRERAELCKGIVRSLSSLSGERPPQPSILDAGELVRRVARSVEYQAGRGQVAVEVTLAAELPPLEGEPTGLEQALVNLASNAVQATPPGGHVSITVRADGDTIEFSVEDDGPGIPLELRRRVFEPFFTTKPCGTGTGLGLALARAIVQGHGGVLEIEDRADSRPGARLVMRLPGGPRAVAPAPELVQGPPASSSGLCVLVVDDDSEIRTLLERVGERRGWSVECAEDGQAALALLHARGEHFHAILCDLHLPGLDGVGVHDRLVLDAPSLLDRFVFVTGEEGFVERSGFGARARGPIVFKPFDLDVIATTLEGRARKASLGAG